MNKWIISGMVASALVAGGAYSISVKGSAPSTPDAGAKRAAASAPAKAAKATPVAAKPMRTIISSADMDANYTTIPQLAQQADLIVRGKVVEVGYVDFNPDAPAAAPHTPR